jgi:hypothetical protein
MDMQQPFHTRPGQAPDKLTHWVEQSLPDAPLYEAPYIVSYTDSDILEELGPALTGSGSGLGPG